MTKPIPPIRDPRESPRAAPEESRAGPGPGAGEPGRRGSPGRRPWTGGSGSEGGVFPALKRLGQALGGPGRREFAPPATAAARSRSGIGQAIRSGCGLVLLLVFLAFLALPILWVLSTSLKTGPEIFRLPPRWLPSPPVLGNYLDVLRDTRVHRYLGNSLVTALASSGLATFLGALAAYGFARHRFRGRRVLLGVVLLVHLCPNLVSMAAIYRLAAGLHLLNSLLGLVLIKGAGLSLAIWLLKGYFESLPRSYEEMAMADGCGPLAIFFRVVLPLRIKGVLVTALFFFAQSWKGFYIPLLLTTRVDKMTLPLGIYQYVGEYGFDAGRICALCVISLVPVLALLVALNRLGWESVRPGG
jgi:ABC-type glycerol-3-phosphate transport system permease component